jgi:hypothetical protein
VARLKLPHFTADTPMFMPVGTQGSVKGLTTEQLQELDCHVILGVLCDAYACAFVCTEEMMMGVCLCVCMYACMCTCVCMCVCVCACACAACEIKISTTSFCTLRLIFRLSVSPQVTRIISHNDQEQRLLLTWVDCTSLSIGRGAC